MDFNFLPLKLSACTSAVYVNFTQNQYSCLMAHPPLLLWKSNSLA